MENNEYLGMQGYCDFDFPEDPEYPEIKSNDDWKGCQGTCDFDPIPNTTGWI